MTLEQQKAMIASMTNIISAASTELFQLRTSAEQSMDQVNQAIARRDAAMKAMRDMLDDFECFIRHGFHHNKSGAFK